MHAPPNPMSFCRAAVNTAVGALALTVMCDALFTSPLLHNDYRSGQLLDAGWFACSLLLVARAVIPLLRRRSAAERHGLWVAVLGLAALLPVLNWLLPSWEWFSG